ncbi:MAG: hypothetical protein OHK0039_15820 [Bacteroidia bacterium]
MNPILVPINLRSDYENILRYAESIALKSGTRLVLFYAGSLLKGGADYTYVSGSPVAELLQRVRSAKIRQNLDALCQQLGHKGIDFSFRFTGRRFMSSLVRETEQQDYELVIMGSHRPAGLRGYVYGALASRLIGRVRVPLFIVPLRSRFNEIEHITYAVDLSDYDPQAVRQVKAIAAVFDAKLTIAHVNYEPEAAEKAQYVSSLERTISDTLDYPKIYYKFFDDTDPLGGIKKLVHLSGSNVLAMISRKQFSWRDVFSTRSMTRKMTQELSVPVLAFRKAP